MLAIKNIHKHYSGSQCAALAGINISIKPYDFYGLLGPNGSGKTTLISIIVGLQSANQGDIEYDGQSIFNNFNAFKQNIGLVPQEIALYQTLTLAENMEYFGALYGLHRQILKKRITECIELVQLSEFFNKPIKIYSGGMKRRANLALSLLHRPKILILDEPTVQVDPQSRQVIFDILTQLNQDKTTIIYTSHYMEEIEKLCNRVAILDGGHVITEDTPLNLIDAVDAAQSIEDVFLHHTGRKLRDEYV